MLFCFVEEVSHIYCSDLHWEVTVHAQNHVWTVDKWANYTWTPKVFIMVVSFEPALDAPCEYAPFSTSIKSNSGIKINASKLESFQFIQQLVPTMDLDWTGGIPRVMMWRTTAQGLLAWCIIRLHRGSNHLIPIKCDSALKPDSVVQRGGVSCN